MKSKSLNLFFRSGCLVVSLLLLCFAALNYAGPSLIAATASGSRKIPIYSVETDKPRVALSFDAAWGNEDTQTLLDILASHNVKATFFMTGGWVDSYPDDVKAIAAAGHDLGNHSQNHPQMSTLSASECEAELTQVHEKVRALTGIEMKLFRPPYGDYNNQLMDVAGGLGYHVIQWNVDSLDWKDYGADDIVSRVLNHKNLCNGSIILMHNGAKYTKAALDRVITGLQEKGYEIVPVSQLIYTSGYTTDHTGRQHPSASVSENPRLTAAALMPGLCTPALSKT